MKQPRATHSGTWKIGENEEIECHRILWENYPPIEECTNMGDTNGNTLDTEIGGLEERVVVLDRERICQTKE